MDGASFWDQTGIPRYQVSVYDPYIARSTTPWYHIFPGLPNLHQCHALLAVRMYEYVSARFFIFLSDQVPGNQTSLPSSY